MTPKDRLRHLLDEMRLSQSGVSVEFGKSIGYISNLLRSDGRIPQDFATWIAEEYNLSLNWLFLGRGPMFMWPENGSRAAESESPYAVIPTDVLIAEVQRRMDMESTEGPSVPKTGE